MMKAMISWAWKAAEFLFTGLVVLTLPLWFPLMIIYVVIDPPYLYALRAKVTPARSTVISFS